MRSYTQCVCLAVLHGEAACVDALVVEHLQRGRQDARVAVEVEQLLQEQAELRGAG